MLLRPLLVLALCVCAYAEKLRTTDEKAARLRALQGEIAAAAAGMRPVTAGLGALAGREVAEDADALRSESKALREEARLALRRMSDLDREFADLRHSYEVNRGLSLVAQALSGAPAPRRGFDISDGAALDAFQESIRRPQEDLMRALKDENAAFLNAERRARARRGTLVTRVLAAAAALSAAAAWFALRGQG